MKYLRLVLFALMMAFMVPAMATVTPAVPDVVSGVQEASATCYQATAYTPYRSGSTLVDRAQAYACDGGSSYVCVSAQRDWATVRTSCRTIYGTSNVYAYMFDCSYTAAVHSYRTYVFVNNPGSSNDFGGYSPVRYAREWCS